MKLLVGCPVRNRMWIMPRWHEHLVAACANAEIVPECIFVADPRDVTFADWAATIGAHLINVDDPNYPDDHYWTSSRIIHMAILRNRLLAEVRYRQPALFLSVDSDILLHPDAIRSLLTAEGYDAVGGKTFMSSGRQAPSYGMLSGQGGMTRQNVDHLIGVDVIMAIKLMTPAAYHVDYVFHTSGEDVGWSTACRRRGLSLGWDGRICSKHVMARDQLDATDERCGF